MRITDVRACVINIPLGRVFGGSVYQIDTRTTIIVEVEAETGILGQIYAGDERRAYREVYDYVMGPLRGAVLGEDPFAIERIWEKMFGLTVRMANKACAMRAIAALDIAIWDMIGKALNAPLHLLLGGYRDRTPVVQFRYYREGEGTGDMIGALLRAREGGIGGVKLKVGGVPVSDDLERVRAIRRALGQEFIIVCDANQAWSLEEAVEFGKAAEELGLAWLEEPVRWHDALHDLRRLRARVSIPVVAGQGESTRFGCWELIEHEAVDILNVDASIAGGITEWRRIAGAASLKGIRMAHHEEPHLAVHLLSAVPSGMFVEVFEEERDPVYYHLNRRLPRIEGGYMAAPLGPGLSLELDHEFIARHLVMGAIRGVAPRRA